MKYIILGLMMTIGSAAADVTFKVNSSVEKLSGSFKNVKITRNGNKIIGLITVKSMVLSKKDKKEDLLEYFDAKEHPITSFKAEVKGGALEGEYLLKGKLKKLKGIVNGNKAMFKIPLTDLVTGYKALFLGSGDHVELKMEIK